MTQASLNTAEYCACTSIPMSSHFAEHATGFRAAASHFALSAEFPAYGRGHLAASMVDMSVVGLHIIRPASQLVPRSKLSPLGHFSCMFGHCTAAIACEDVWL